MANFSFFTTDPDPTMFFPYEQHAHPIRIRAVCGMPERIDLVAEKGVAGSIC
jgi:hypothetical protein